MEFDTKDLYEQLWNVSHDSLTKHCAIAVSLTNMMQKRAEYLRSQLSLSLTTRSKTLANDFRKAYDELQDMGKSVETFVTEWQHHFIGELTSVFSNGLVPSNVDYKFDYTKLPLAYEKGQLVKLLVSDIPSTTWDVFCAVDVQSVSFVQFNAFQSVTKTPMERLPPSGEAFAVMLENVWFRAVRNRPNSNTDEDEPIAICLLDSGEVLSYQPSFPIAKLPEEFQTIPAFFVKVRMVATTNSVKFSGSDVISCKVVDVEEDNDVLRVELLPKNLADAKLLQGSNENQEETQSGGEKAQEPMLNGQHLPVNPEKPVSTGNRTSKDGAQSVPNSSDDEPAPEPPCNGDDRPGDNKYAITRESFSKEALALLDEVPESTTNAMKAVLGYVPKDDELICKFYDPKTKGCFKGGNCRLRHVKMDPDGWTRDRDTVSVSTKMAMEIPAQNKYVTLIPTMVIDCELFYCQIVNENGINEPFSELMEQLNHPEVIANYKPLKLIPGIGELVLAKYENVWYRAQVCELFDTNVSLFYVDYGNVETLPLDEVRQLTDRFKHLPCQAVACRVANVRHLKRYHIEAIEQFTAAVLDKQLSACIIDNKTPWEVQLFDETGRDIGEEMIVTKMAARRTAEIINDKSRVPG